MKYPNGHQMTMVVSLTIYLTLAAYPQADFMAIVALVSFCVLWLMALIESNL